MKSTIPSIVPLADTLTWRMAATSSEREAAAIAWVRQGQRETGKEHAAILTADGDLVYAGTSGLHHRVAIPVGRDGRDVVIHHSHPAEVSLSTADFHVAWRRSSKSEVRAHTPGGATFRGRALINPLDWTVARAGAAAGLASELRVLGRRDQRSYVHLAFHIANLEMEALGWVWYRYDLSAGVLEDLARLPGQLPALRAAARQELERDVRT